MVDVGQRIERSVNVGERALTILAEVVDEAIDDNLILAHRRQQACVIILVAERLEGARAAAGRSTRSLRVSPRRQTDGA